MALTAYNDSNPAGVSATVVIHVTTVVYYVSLDSTNPLAPYTSWATAATNIQDAVDLAAAGSSILVSNGVYQTGGRIVYGSLSNRVAVTRPLTVQSVNGPSVTVIRGYQVPGTTNGDNAVRCVYLTNAASLIGFTLTNGATRTFATASQAYGGGVWCESTNAVVSNCIIAGNSGFAGGGAAYSGELDNCTIANNSAPAGSGGGCFQTTLNNCTLTRNWAANSGGGAYSGTLNNCTLTGNSSPSGGGAVNSTLNNCIVYYNSAPSAANYLSATLNYCCTLPLPGGVGNITTEPQLTDAGHVSGMSPCRGGGSVAYTTGTDIDGEPWLQPPSIGCDEYYPGTTGPLGVTSQADYTNVTVGYNVTFDAMVVGHATSNVWDYGDGTRVTNQFYGISHSWAAAGDYPVVLTAYNDDNPAGVSATVTMHVIEGIYYVALNSANPVPPFTSWATAATNIQDAIDAALPGNGLVLVSNGIYATGGRVVNAAMGNRVAVTKALTVESFNGPAVTVIRGYQVPGTINGDGAIRCVYLTNGASLIGFTLTNGATRTSGDADTAQGGGGIFCLSTNTLISNCILVGNSAGNEGGGAIWGTFNNCSFIGNSAAIGYGGGAISSVLNNCSMVSNTATLGGGAYGSVLNNCTLVANSAASQGGGAYSSVINNSIVYYNLAPSAANYSGSLLNYSCTLPFPIGGTGNIATEPQLTDFTHISSTSPCRGAGNAVYATGTDIDGEPWLNPPSIGCDEYYTGAVTGPLSVAVQASYTNASPDFTVNFVGQIVGHARVNVWDFGDGTRVTNQFYNASHSWAVAGDYPVVLTAYNDDNPAGVSAAVVIHVTGVVHYVSLNSTNPVAPYSSWATAATNIQDAIDVAVVPGAVVLVSNGVYQTGGRIVSGSMSNRVVVSKQLTVRSVNGPAVTMIRGHQVPGTTNGDAAMRCVYLTNAASLIGFTLTSGATRVSGNGDNEQGGGGVFCPSTNAFISNCVLAGNAAGLEGGAAVWGTFKNCSFVANSAPNGGAAIASSLNNCLVVSNTAGTGGGVYNAILNNCALAANTATGPAGGAYVGVLNNCTLTGNTAGQGGGAFHSTLNNCTIYYNTAPDGSNYLAGDLYFCCTTPFPGSVGNITTEPQLTDIAHVSSTSPCRGAGNAGYATGTDIDGEPWLNPPSIGCDEYHAGAVTGPLTVAVQANYTNVGPAFSVTFTGQITGRARVNVWDFGDGARVTNRFYGILHSWAAAGDYPVVLTAYNDDNPAGVSATVTVHVIEGTYYVALSSANPVPPFSSWGTAATNIQDAIDAALPGKGFVLVSNGIYATGGRVVNGSMSNRVAVTKTLTVESVNGPAVTVIRGYQVPGTINGNGAIRCVYLTNGASLIGFTLTNGATRVSGNGDNEQGGGGIFCPSTNALVTNCILVGNAGGFEGGGAVWGTFNNCSFVANSAPNGGGAISSVLNNCSVVSNTASTSGGGAYGGVLNNCTLVANSAANGGGTISSVLNNCIMVSNSANFGGGAYGGVLNNCTLVANSSASRGGGAYSGVINNSIAYYNSAPVAANCFSSTLNYCCTTPLLGSGIGNFTNEPILLNPTGGNLRLQFNSPCINAGNNAYVSVAGANDLDTNPRIVGFTVDLGAYEFQMPGSILSYAWAVKYGLPIDGSADYTDSDGDGMNNWQEWIAGTDPTDATSVLRLLAPSVTPAGLLLRWNSDTNHAYFIERTTTLEPLLSFTLLRTNVPGLPGTTTFTDLTGPAAGAAFYRVGTDSTNGSAPLWLQTPLFVPAAVTVTWTSVTNRTYCLERSTDLAAQPSFSLLQSNIVGQAGTTGYMDTNAVGSGPYFYRVGVQ